MGRCGGLGAVQGRFRGLAQLDADAEMIGQVDGRAAGPDDVEVALHLGVLRAHLAALLVPPEHVVQALVPRARRRVVVPGRVGGPCIFLRGTDQPGPKILETQFAQRAAGADRDAA